MHGVVFAIETPRFTKPLDQHFRENEPLYVSGNVHRIHIKPIIDREQFVVEYAGKAIKYKRLSSDDILILPKSLSEVAPSQSALVLEKMSPKQRAIRAIQDRYNVSDEIALSMYLTQSPRTDRSHGD
jgi:hypothetical protein